MSNTLRTRNVANGDMFSYYFDSFSSRDFSIEDIKNEIADAPVINPRFRFHLLNEDETIREDIPEEDVISGGSFQENYQNGQRRSVSLSLFNYSGKYNPSINGLWTGTKISFDMGLEIDGNPIWFPKGVYVISSINASHEQGTMTVNVELSDKFAELEGANGTIETTYSIGTDIKIKDIISDLLMLPKGNGQPIDPKPIIYHSAFKDSVTQVEITKESGSTIGSIILDLATQLSAEVFYDVEGNLNFVPINDVTDDVDKPIIYDYYDEDGSMGNNSLSFGFSDVINRIIVIGATVNGEVMTATAVNDNAASPVCYQRIGYRTASPINDTNITSQILAQERAEYELRQKLILKTTVSNTVRYNPLLMVNSLVAITDEFYGMSREKVLIQSISCPIDYSGTMSISSSNIQNFAFTTGRA